MENQKPKSIKTVGLVVAICSVFIIFSNLMGAFAWSILEMGNNMENSEVGIDPISFLFSHYLEMCLIMLLIGIPYLIGGIFIRKYKLWANRMITILSILLFLIIWGLMIAMSISAAQQDGMEIFSFFAILNALIWSTPIALLIWFLNKKKIKIHFT